MSTTKPATGWSRDDPRIDGVYWWRADANDTEPDIHSIAAGYFYQIGNGLPERVENHGGERLGPITPADFEQLAALREAAEVADKWFNDHFTEIPCTIPIGPVTAALRNGLQGEDEK